MAEQIKWDFKVDEFLAGLLPRLQESQMEGLKASLKAEGKCLSPLVVWEQEGLLIDGYHRMRLVELLRSEGHKIEQPQVVKKSFVNRAAVISWMLENQDARRNWTPQDKAAAVLRNETVILELQKQAKENQSNGGKGGAHAPKVSVRATLAKIAGVGEGTIATVSKVLNSGNQKVISDLLENHSISLREAGQKVRDTIKRAKANAMAANAGTIGLPPLSPELLGTYDRFILADVLEGLKTVKDASISLVVTSPPYPLQSIVYENTPRYEGDYQQYLNWLKEVFAAIKPKMVSGGRVVVNLDSVNDHGNSLYHSLITDFTKIMLELGYLSLAEICWYKQNSVGARPNWGTHPIAGNSEEIIAGPRSPRIRRQHEYLMVFAVETPFLEGQVENVDITPEEFELFTMSHWYIRPQSRAKVDSPEYHPAPYPEELVYRLLKLYSYTGDIILDPFSGSGTTCFVAACLNRHWIGVDNSPSYVEASQARMKTLENLTQKEKRENVKRFIVSPAVAGEENPRTDGYSRVKDSPAK